MVYPSRLWPVQECKSDWDWRGRFEMRPRIASPNSAGSNPTIDRLKYLAGIIFISKYGKVKQCSGGLSVNWTVMTTASRKLEVYIKFKRISICEGAFRFLRYCLLVKTSKTDYRWWGIVCRVRGRWVCLRWLCALVRPYSPDAASTRSSDHPS